MTHRHILLRVLFFREPSAPSVWIAQALEYDIAAYGGDVDQARRAFEHTISGYVAVAEGRREEPFRALGPAPDLFWQLWAKLVPNKSVMTAEPIQSIPGHMIQVVSHDAVSTAY